jgi:hypothetical protein
VIVRTIENGARYEAASPEHGVEFHLDRLRRDRHELIGELSVACGLLGARAIDGVLSVGTFNLSSPRARQERAKLLADRSRTNGKVDWSGLLEELCQHVLHADRVGAPALVLRDVPKPEADQQHDVAGLRVPQHHATILFGDGGTVKSYLSLYAGGALAQRGVRVALFDWELDAAQHRLRLERLFPRAMPDVRYVRCDRPLIYEVDRLHRIARADALDFAIFDSAGYACAGKPEEAEGALAYFRCVRQIGTGSLHIAHVTKGDNGDQKPFGSSFWHNSARATWFVKHAATSPDGAVVTIGLFNRKANLGPLQPALAYDVTFMSERTVIQPVEIAKVDELADSLPLWQRMKDALTNGPRTLASLAETLEASVDTLDRTVRRKSALFTRVSRDGIAHIALVERRAS